MRSGELQLSKRYSMCVERADRWDSRTQQREASRRWNRNPIDPKRIGTRELGLSRGAVEVLRVKIGCRAGLRPPQAVQPHSAIYEVNE